MTVIESLPIALFCIVMVFAVLAILFFLIKLFSLGIGAFESKSNKPEAGPSVTEHKAQAEFSSGELKLYNTDERTAAMVMAIVSDESGIPLSELCFKSIKLISQEKFT